MVEARDTGPGDAGFSPVRTVLVVTCDSTRGGALVTALQRRGFPAPRGEDAAQAHYWAGREPPALAILDARVGAWRPLARELRRDGCQLMALTGDADARAAALEEGCVEVPLDSAAEEVAARAGILLERSWLGETGRVAAGPLVVDLSRSELLWRGEQMEAPRLLLRLAAFLAAHAGRFVPTKVLLERVWGEPPWATGADLNKVHQAVWRLRQLLGEPADSRFLVGRRHHGYAILPEADSRQPPRPTTPSLRRPVSAAAHPADGSEVGV